MKKEINPVVAIVAIVLLVCGALVTVWKGITGSSAAVPVVVKPTNPDDPKFKPDPKLGLGGT